jgi:hypothetical protein
MLQKNITLMFFGDKTYKELIWIKGDRLGKAISMSLKHPKHCAGRR